MNSRDVAMLKRLIEIFQHSHFSCLAISVSFPDPLHSKWECSLVCVKLALKGEQRALAGLRVKMPHHYTSHSCWWRSLLHG